MIEPLEAAMLLAEYVRQPQAAFAWNVRQVDLGLHTSYLETEHTPSHFRHCLWLPELIERAGRGTPEAERQVLDKTQEKVDSLVAQYSKPEGRGQQLTAMRAVVEKAKADLCA